jgi:thiamine biosynthesis lipoprotein
VPEAYAREHRPGPRVNSDLDGGLAIDRPDVLRGLHRYSHEAMATVFEVYTTHPDPAYAAQAAQAAFELVDQLERELSRFRPNSDITRINHLRAGERTRVSPSTIECLLIAHHMFDVTAGAFDISIGTGLPSLSFDSDECLVHAAGSGVQLDLGGVGKGYAVDRMAELLEDWGLRSALVHGGFSSVLALDPPGTSEGWPLTLSDPASRSRVLSRPTVRQTAFGASGLRKGDHILDPRTTQPARGRAAAWVAVPRPQAPVAHDGPRIAAAAVADALTTAFMLLDIDEIRTICHATPGVQAWVLPDAAHEVVHFGI